MSKYIRTEEIERILDSRHHERMLTASEREWWRKALVAFGKKERNEVHRQNIAATTARLEEAGPLVLRFGTGEGSWRWTEYNGYPAVEVRKLPPGIGTAGQCLNDVDTSIYPVVLRIEVTKEDAEASYRGARAVEGILRSFAECLVGRVLRGMSSMLAERDLALAEVARVKEANEGIQAVPGITAPGHHCNWLPPVMARLGSGAFVELSVIEEIVADDHLPRFISLDTGRIREWELGGDGKPTGISNFRVPHEGDAVWVHDEERAYEFKDGYWVVLPKITDDGWKGS